ncbi:MAG: hypothetical protein HN396_06955 [Gemmatimonadales bacterium]|nr:hypothetical protein [Gemmatimonadales bacterium]NCG34045.1 hypothetical protein [Pseudomonadota bacterium]MBT3499796.1 hypothetical protein [Gemmatimonadales bacterium]MBT3774924.1 hypothetical protein [Gemmatimonadales bacterium]MBT3958041.1 hypothetical protein [Gemmatimonadales bacterium]
MWSTRTTKSQQRCCQSRLQRRASSGAKSKSRRRLFRWYPQDARRSSPRRSSTNQALDRAALSIADVYRFTPAKNRNQAVPVGVSFPITFQVR